MVVILFTSLPPSSLLPPSAFLSHLFSARTQYRTHAKEEERGGESRNQGARAARCHYEILRAEAEEPTLSIGQHGPLGPARPWLGCEFYGGPPRRLLRTVSHLSVSDRCETNVTRPGDWISLAAHNSKPHPAQERPPPLPQRSRKSCG